MSSKLPQSTDARDWASEFMEFWGHRLNEIDEELMLTWFANAIMAGVDEANRRTRNSRNSIEITLFKKPNDPNERVNKPNYNPPSFEDFDK